MGALLSRWRLAALAASAAMLAIAHGFETFGHLAPCMLCLRQREAYWAAGSLALASMLVVRSGRRARLRAISCLLLALIFMTGAVVAAYHAGVEWKFWPGPGTCSGGSTGVSAADLAAFAADAPAAPPSCDTAPWVFLGLSMAGWNALISAALAGLSVAAAWKERSRR